MATHNDLGKKGEELAADYLMRKGHTIIAENWRFQRAEIDLITRFQDYLVMVEVKTRSSTIIEQPKAAVTLKKQQQMVKAANGYILENHIDLECRFDVIGIVIADTQISIEHIEDAFYPT